VATLGYKCCRAAKFQFVRTGWTTVTNLPTLITNIEVQTINYQVVLPLSGGQGFYRLNSP
jgi:hypothetical protein